MPSRCRHCSYQASTIPPDPSGPPNLGFRNHQRKPAITISPIKTSRETGAGGRRGLANKEGFPLNLIAAAHLTTDQTISTHPPSTNSNPPNPTPALHRLVPSHQHHRVLVPPTALVFTKTRTRKKADVESWIAYTWGVVFESKFPRVPPFFGKSFLALER